MTINYTIRDELPEAAIVFDSLAYDNSIIGVTIDDRVVYDYDMMVKELMEDEEMTCDEAMDWIDYNTIRSLPYAGPMAPIIMYRIYKGDDNGY